MPVPASINDLSTTAGNNSPAGSESPTTADDYLRTLSAFIATLRDSRLVKADNLSDIPDKPAARGNLGLGTAAVAAVTTSDADVTAGRVMRVGDGGLITPRAASNADVNTIAGNGFFSVASNAPNWPFGDVGGTILSQVHSVGQYLTQLAINAATGAIKSRVMVAGTWQAWSDVLRLSDFTSNQLLATNGYQRLPGGFVIQVGNFNAAGGTTTAVTYPTAFPNAAIAWSGIGSGARSSTAEAMSTITNETLTGFTYSSGYASSL